MSVKEEGDASSINQAYDKDVAKTDKKVQRETLSVVHELEGSNNCITQWHLLICGLSAVRYTAAHRHIWENSFIAVNLHPQHMISFEEWCQRISPKMMSADSYELTRKENVDPYHLLPALWQAMTPENKRMAVRIVESHGRD